MNQQPTAPNGKYSTKKVITIVIVCVFGVLALALPLMGLAAVWFGTTIRCNQLKGDGPKVLKEQRESVDSAFAPDITSSTEPKSSSSCTAGGQEYVEEVQYTANNVSTNDIETRLQRTLAQGSTLSDVQYRANSEGAGACGWVTIKNKANTKIRYHINYLYDGAKEDQCAYWSNASVPYDREPSAVQGQLSFVIKYQYGS